MSTLQRTLIWATSTFLTAGVASAASVTPTSYSMENGGTGSYNYWDDSYDGSGNNQVNYALLSGGTGDLTDGVIATDNWNVLEPPVGANGPYVGWASRNPTIDFFFDQAYSFNTITFYLDDANGFGGVSPPLSVSVEGMNYAVPDGPSGDPFSFTVNLGGLTTDELSVQLFRQTTWIFLSEVTFDAEGGIAPIPLPAGGLLLLSGLGALTISRRRVKIR